MTSEDKAEFTAILQRAGIEAVLRFLQRRHEATALEYEDPDTARTAKEMAGFWARVRLDFKEQFR